MNLADSSTVVAPPLGTLPSALGPLSFCLTAIWQSYPEWLRYRHPWLNPALPPKALLHRSPCSHCGSRHQGGSQAPTGSLWQFQQTVLQPDMSGSVRAPVGIRLGASRGLPRPQVRSKFLGESGCQQAPFPGLSSPKAHWNPGGRLVCREAQQRSHSDFSFWAFRTFQGH